MPNTASQSSAIKDTGRRDRRPPQRSRLGKTWQDRSWRQKLLGSATSVAFWMQDSDRMTSRRALPGRH